MKPGLDFCSRVCLLFPRETLIDFSYEKLDLSFAQDISKLGKAVILSKTFVFLKRHMHIYSMFVTFLQTYKLFA